METLKLNLPEYLTVDIYKKLTRSKGEGNAHKIVNAVAAILEKNIEEVKSWPIGTIKEVSDDLADLAMPEETFHAMVEFDDVLYGYAHMKQMTLGEYIDLETLSKNPIDNLEQIAALLYRPVTDNRFKSLKFMIKQKVKAVNNDVPNPFDYYTIEKYNNESRKDRAELFKSFPAHVVLGALTFFLAVGGLYLRNTTYFNKSLRTKKVIDKMMLENLSQITGVGSGQFSVYLNPTSFQSQETFL